MDTVQITKTKFAAMTNKEGQQPNEGMIAGGVKRVKGIYASIRYVRTASKVGTWRRQPSLITSSRTGEINNGFGIGTTGNRCARHAMIPRQLKKMEVLEMEAN